MFHQGAIQHFSQEGIDTSFSFHIRYVVVCIDDNIFQQATFSIIKGSWKPFQKQCKSSLSKLWIKRLARSGSNVGNVGDVGDVCGCHQTSSSYRCCGGGCGHSCCDNHRSCDLYRSGRNSRRSCYGSSGRQHSRLQLLPKPHLPHSRPLGKPCLEPQLAWEVGGQHQLLLHRLLLHHRLETEQHPLD